MTTINSSFNYEGMQVWYTATEDRSNADEPLIVDVTTVMFRGVNITEPLAKLIGLELLPLHEKAVEEAEYKLIKNAA